MKYMEEIERYPGGQIKRTGPQQRAQAEAQHAYRTRQRDVRLSERRKWSAQGREAATNAGQPWDEWSDAVVQAPWCVRQTDANLAELLGRSVSAISGRRSALVHAGQVTRGWQQ